MFISLNVKYNIQMIMIPLNIVLKYLILTPPDLALFYNLKTLGGINPYIPRCFELLKDPGGGMLDPLSFYVFLDSLGVVS